MIGQKILQKQIDELLHSSNFPRFVIFVGERGSGKTLIARNTAVAVVTGSTEVENVQFHHSGDDNVVECDNSIDNVRYVIEQAYKVNTTTAFCWLTNIDDMSTAAQNALLKITEEPPNNAYFIMTTRNAESVLSTIRSRATMLYMDNYSLEDLENYVDRAGDAKTQQGWQDFCTTIGDINIFLNMDYQQKDGQKAFLDYVKLVVDNVAKVSGSNSFKISSKIALSADDKDNFDLILFWKAFRAECLKRLQSSALNPFQCISGINITSNYLQELRVAGVNRQMCFDNWLLDIRKDWMQYAES